MSKVSLLKLYFIFAKIGAILIGGGYVILPILISELSKKRNLIDESDLIDYFAISQSMPGIVAANISMFTGYKLRGKIGAIAAMLGIVTIPFWCIIFLAVFLEKFSKNPYILGAFNGIEIAVIVLILLTAREVWHKTSKDPFFYLIFITTLIALTIFKLSPIYTIILFTTTGIILKIIRKEDR